MSLSEKHKTALNTIKLLTMKHGREVVFGHDLISQLSGIPEIELWDWDNDTGILLDLNDYGYIVVDRAKNPTVSLDSSTLV